ncbi:fibronectin type III domain-containing protein, partial [Actinoplanes sp. NPDC051633]|uniref:fibronectin type III domain-containing protein n=1 Tax=Actinoplanes sp. NPDC051633 TaxID=3155670 RepID=UPI00343795C9
PAAVTAVRTKAVNRGLQISWRPVADFGSGDFVSYLAVTSDFGAFCEVTTPTGTGCRLTGLTNGADYDVTVLTYATEGSTISEFTTAAPGVTTAASPTRLAPAEPPGEGGGDLPSTGGEPVVWSTVALGFLLIGLGLAALTVNKVRRAR